MRISMLGVQASAPGFHPITTFNLWRFGLRCKKNKETEQQFIDACKAAGMTVTVNGVKQ